MNVYQEKYVSLTDKNDDNKKAIIFNVKSIILYSLSLTVALGFNELIVEIFDSFSNKQHIIAKVTYVMIMFGLAIFSAYWLTNNLN